MKRIALAIAAIATITVGGIAYANKKKTTTSQ